MFENIGPGMGWNLPEQLGLQADASSSRGCNRGAAAEANQCNWGAAALYRELSGAGLLT